MIGAGRELHAHRVVPDGAIPGLAIVLTVLALNLIGDGLNDALNPRCRTADEPSHASRGRAI